MKIRDFFPSIRFDEASVFYHDQPLDGLVRICRLAVFQKYPKYLTEGFEALYSRPPVIYISSAAKPGLGEYICQQVQCHLEMRRKFCCKFFTKNKMLSLLHIC